MRRVLIAMAVGAALLVGCASASEDVTSASDEPTTAPVTTATSATTVAPAAAAPTAEPSTTAAPDDTNPPTVRPSTTVTVAAVFDTSRLNALVTALAGVQPLLDRPIAVRDVQIASPRAVLDGYVDTPDGVAATVEVGNGCAVRVMWDARARELDVGRSNECPTDGAPAGDPLADQVARAVDGVGDLLLDDVYAAVLPLVLADGAPAVGRLADLFPGVRIVDDPAAVLDLRVVGDPSGGGVVLTTPLVSGGCAHLRAVISSNTTVERAHGACDGSSLAWAADWPPPTS